jgi:hypothetical protein
MAGLTARPDDEPSAAPPQAQPLSDDVVQFLLGSAPLDGVWFGERHPTERGAFWWRKHLSKAPQVQPQPIPQWKLDEFARDMVKGGRSVNWLAEKIAKEYGIGQQESSK